MQNGRGGAIRRPGPAMPGIMCPGETGEEDR